MEAIQIVLDYIFVRDSRAEVLFFVLLFFGLSIIVGGIFRNNYAEALLMGLLVLLGATNLSVFVFRSIGIDLNLFGWFALSLAFALAFCLRALVVDRSPFNFRISPWPVLVFLLLASAIWLTQIITTEPAAGMSSHQAWYPLYLSESFSRGEFLTHEDMRFAPGFLASLLFNVDLLGLAALGTWVGAEAGYAPFLAAAIVCGMASAGIYAWGLRNNGIALVGGAVFFLLYFRTDPDFRLILGSNWGDVVMYLSGAAVLYYLMRSPDRSDRWVLVAVAALFLPFGRHFGVMYAGLICAVALAMHWRQHRALNYRIWGTIFVIGCVFSVREIYLILTAASPYYEASRYLFEYHRDVTGTLIYNIGIDLTDSRPLWGKLFYAAPLIVAGIALLLKSFRTKYVRLSVDTIVSPLALFLPPIMLVLITGSYGGASYNKVFAITVFLHVFYVWRLVALADVGRSFINWMQSNRSKIVLVATVATVVCAVVSSDKIRSHRIVRDGVEPALSWAFETYRSNNADLVIARTLDGRPNLLKQARERPVLYLHYEPGLTLRYFIGGSFFSDFDYWSDEVFDVLERSNSFEEAVRRLGNPLIYISFGTGLNYGAYVRGDAWGKFAEEIRFLDDANWITAQVSGAGARLYFPDRASK